MPYVPIDTNIIKVGDPITKELLDLIKDNFENHESRINQNETTGGSLFILNSGFNLANLNKDAPHIFYYKAMQDFELNDFRIQLFDKQGISSGNLSFDLQKSSDTNDANFNSVLTGPITFPFATAVQYSTEVGTFSNGEVLVGNVIRIEVTAIPLGFTGNVLIYIGGA